MDRNNIVIDIDQMVDGRCIICLQVLSNVVACVSAPMGFCLDMKSYISCFGTWSGYKIQISLVYSAALHFSGHDQPWVLAKELPTTMSVGQGVAHNKFFLLLLQPTFYMLVLSDHLR